MLAQTEQPQVCTFHFCTGSRVSGEKCRSRTLVQKSKNNHQGSLLMFLFPTLTALRFERWPGHCCASSHSWPQAPSLCSGGKSLAWEWRQILSHRLRIPSTIHLVLGPVLGLQEKTNKPQNSKNIGPILTSFFFFFANTCVTDSQPPCSKSNFMNQYVYIETESKTCYLKVIGLSLIRSLHNNENDCKGNLSVLRLKVILKEGHWNSEFITHTSWLSKCQHQKTQSVNTERPRVIHNKEFFNLRGESRRCEDLWDV